MAMKMPFVEWDLVGMRGVPVAGLRDETADACSVVSVTRSTLVSLLTAVERRVVCDEI
jgi:hypothetical protein